MAKRQKSESARAQEQEDLRRIGEKRVTKALKQIALVGNLARLRPTPTQQQSIIDALRDAVKAVEARFAGAVEAAESFKLP